NIIDVSTVFQTISDNVRTGTLTVSVENKKCLIYFNRGQVQVCYSINHVSFLGEALQRANTVDPSLLQSLLQRQKESKKSLITLLQEEGIADLSFIKKLCEFQIVEDIYELFRWLNPICTFEESPPNLEIFDSELLKLNISMNVSALLMEAARREDEWGMIQKVIPSLLDVPYLKNNIPPHLVNENQQMLLMLINGERNVSEMLDQIHMSQFSAMELLKKMLQDKYVAFRTGEELLEMVKRSPIKENIVKQIHLFERAEALGKKNIETIHWLSQAYESIYQEDKALKKYLELGEVAQKEENLAMAAKAFEKVIGLNPEYLPAYEKLIKLLFSLNFLTEAAEKSNLYAQKLRSQNKIKAVEILLEANKSDESLENLELLATIYIDMGERIDALLTYEKLAQKYEENQQLLRSIEIYEKMLTIDEENLEAYLNLATLLTRLGRTDEAVKQYKRLADKLNSTGVIKNSFTCLYLINVCNKIMEFEPENFSAREWLVDAYIYKKETPKAITMLEELLTILDKKEDPYAKIVNLKKYVLLKPDAFDRSLQLGKTFLDIGEKDEARTVYFGLAEVALKHKTFSIAKEALQKILQFDPFHLETHLKIAEILTQEKLIREAAEKYRILGFFYKGINQFEQSTQMFEKAMELAPQEQIECALEIGENYKRLKMLDYSISILQNFAAKTYAEKNYGQASKACKRILALQHNEPWAIDLMKKLSQI
ncbi:MAG: DUF4388 domain-containing protein, partial [Planctomycetota bacterium]